MAINYANKEDYPPNSLLGLPPLILLDNILTSIALDKKENNTVCKLRACCKKLNRIITHPSFLAEVRFDPVTVFAQKLDSQYMSFVKECAANDNVQALSICSVITCFRDCSANFEKGLDGLKSVSGSIRSGDYAYAMLTLHYDGSRLAAELMLHRLMKKGKLEKVREPLLKHFVGKHVNLSKVPSMHFDSCCVPNCGSITNPETQYFNPSCSVKCAIQTEYENFRMRLKEVTAQCHFIT